MKEKIYNEIEYIVANFLYYDRKEDEDLPIGVIEDLISKGEITIDELVFKFKEHLESSLK